MKCLSSLSKKILNFRSQYLMYMYIDFCFAALEYSCLKASLYYYHKFIITYFDAVLEYGKIEENTEII